MNDTFFLPKPMTHIENSVDNGDSSIKKAYKKIQFIPADDIDAYFMGEYDVRTAPDLDNNLGSFDMKVLASIRGEEETKPYRISTYYFEEGNGLYIIVGYEGDDTLSFIDNLLHNLSFSGIGGKRMAGMGKFKLYPESVPNDIQNRLETKGKRYMTLSVSLPREEEMERVLKDAEYILCKRSGFVSSDKYAKNYMRKKDLYVLKTGACVSEKYKGDIYDVSGKMGEHPVYRYAKPMFLKV
jgi:CRISPR-associated protein Csm4